MKVLLIPNPVIESGRPKPYVPLGILSLATVLKNDGFQVQILDVNEICEDASYRAMPEAICACEPDIVGFSTWCNYYLDVIKAAATVRKKLPNVKIMFGGVQATHTDRETLEAFPQIDVVARGESEHTISEIVDSIHDPDKLRNVPGVTFMYRGDLIKSPNQGPVKDLDKLPFPDYSLLPSMDKIDRVGIDVGRGCPFKCGYCVSNSLGEGKFRQRSVANVVTIVKKIIADYGKTNFRFEHDMLTLNRKWLIQLCDSLEREKLNVQWECFSRIDTIDAEMIERMAAAGCSYIYFGIETGSPRMQKLLNKRLKLSSAPSVIRKVCDAEISCSSGFIFGFPQEHKADIAQTMRLILEISCCSDKGLSETMVWLLVPFAGSPLFDKFGQHLGIDEHLSNFAVSSATLVDLEFARKYPQVFSTLNHFKTKHVSRDIFVRVVHLMGNLDCLRYTGFALLRDSRLGYPESLLDRIEELPLPAGNIFHCARLHQPLAAVADFIAKTVNRLGFKDHYIHDLIKFDLAWHTVDTDEITDEQTLVEEFSHDVLAFIREARAGRFRYLPETRNDTPCSVLFRKRCIDGVQAVKLPEVFREKFKNSGLVQKTST
jgi:radical SAM superfamily enzyme YgiQ (UPF0313 family)